VTTELLEVAFRFGRAVTGLATGDEPLRRRLAVAGHELLPADGALSGLWPEPHLTTEMADQVRDVLARLTADGTIEATVAAMDDRTVALAAQQVTALAFALQQAVGAAER
jgi:hypothetical protein